ncbi:hypothetical protein SBA5_80025 [Candidatus Sulfotelmatomonas gaucii]|uniref:Uncharacterized protein n=1 Tax=Candidatus Sulfuritelmatomonas gaucii TaxID=2043161 RepID=A0A2N9M585_9BACT|nr:hypothetical protein SBA5_80025 [Candidatus Sulfotelmatomonas gaucii]
MALYQGTTKGRIENKLVIDSSIGRMGKIGAINEEFAPSGSAELMVVAFFGRRGLGDV